jgi:release factor glutamine methyltransferase
MSPDQIVQATIKSALTEAQERLAAVSETASLDAQLLLAHILEKERAWVLAYPEYKLSFEDSQVLKTLLKRLEGGEPLPYILGQWEFFGLKFHLTHDVLIPRPETELLVGEAIAWLKANPSRRRVLEVGTGSGCISVSIAKNIENISIIATDISKPALEIAKQNAARHAVSNTVTFQENDLLDDGLQGKFDLICANLPYIPSETLRGLPVSKHEPALALDGGPDGLGLIRRLLAEAPRLISPDGLVLLEIEASQGESAPAAARQYFPDAYIIVKEDLAGHPRLLIIKAAQR